jgi:hypothetical protein
LLQAWQSIRDVVRYELRQRGADTREIWFIGHGLAAPVAAMGALEVSLGSANQGSGELTGSSDGVTVQLFSTGCPRYGNQYYCDLYDLAVPRSWRLYSDSDATARLPLGPAIAQLYANTHDGMLLVPSEHISSRSTPIVPAGATPGADQLPVEGSLPWRGTDYAGAN